MLAAMLAALMSSLTSQFNSSSSIFVIDLWLYWRKKASQFEVVLVGRIFGLFMIGLSIGWLPILQAIQGGSLWDYVQSISSFITPPWVVAFLLGMFWSRLTEKVGLPYANNLAMTVNKCNVQASSVMCRSMSHLRKIHIG